MTTRPRRRHTLTKPLAIWLTPIAVLLLTVVACGEPATSPAEPASLPTAPVDTPLVSPSTIPRATPRATAPSTPPGASAMLEDERNTIDVFRNTSNSVVFVTSTQLQRSYFGLSTQQVSQDTGSGFVWDDDRHIVTNFHVVNGSNSFSVSFANGNVYEAKLIGIDPYKDLAVLEMDKSVAMPSPLARGSSSDLMVGQKVLAIGNPFGLDHTLTTGVISALGREMQSLANTTIEDVIQTDASINPGNSGGPLLDSAGRLIGVNTSIVSQSGQSAGIGFAVPVDTVKRVVPQLIKEGRVRRVGIGVRILPDHQAANWGVEGVIIREPVPGGPAAAIGIRAMEVDRQGNVYADIIIGIDDKRIAKFDDLFRVLDTRKPGDEVTLHLNRGGEVSQVLIKLQELE